MHITASAFINDDESELKWLEKLAPHEQVSKYRHNDTGEDNANAPMERQVMGRELVLAISNGQLYLATTATGRTSMLEDLARCALIYTPSWSVVSDEQIVSSAILKSLQTSESHEAYIKGDFTEHSWVHDALGQDMPYRKLALTRCRLVRQSPV